MGISLRHHVLSLVASFLMLFVGLLVGVGLSSEPQLQEAIDKLNVKFEENSTLRVDVDSHERFARAALPRLVAGKLDGQTISILVTARPEDSQYASEVSDALEAAGAKAPYRLVCRKDFVDRAVGAFGGNSAAACEKAAQEIARNVAEANRDGLRALKRRKLVRIHGDIPTQRPTAVVVLGGAEEEAQAQCDSIDRPLLEALAAAGIDRVVGCEDTPEVSYMETYREFDIATVDNVDLARGQVSLVLAVAGESGNYGDSPAAKEEFPELR